MKYCLFGGLVLIILLSSTACSKKSGTSSVNIPTVSSTTSITDNTRKTAPDFTEKDIQNNKTISLQNYRGKAVILNFWGTWCPPCKEEIPALESLQDDYKNKLAIIGVAVFSSSDSIRKFCKDYGINYPVIEGSYDLIGKYGRVSAIPTTFIIDRDGKITGRVIGSRTKSQYEEILKPLL